MAFAVVAALRARDRGHGGRHIDFSMLEGLLWTMPGALLEPQLTGSDLDAHGNADATYSPHGLYPATGDDRWLAIAVRDDAEWRALCSVVPGLSAAAAMTVDQRRAVANEIDAHLRDWVRKRDAIEAMQELQAAGVPASASYTTNDMFGDPHLWARGFYREVTGPDGTPRFLPGLPWRWGDGAMIGPRAAPALGEHTEAVLRDIAGLSQDEVDALSVNGAFGREA
jgi:crotonobetainyl-CoA:carnitine CoA-transferase CaiB-like acyl-CoA transferase